MTCNKNLNVINVMFKRNIFFCAKAVTLLLTRNEKSSGGGIFDFLMMK